tara:strand:+ start:1676 stop:1924 length:249 start_codon:yes stop_codon:yes gene_type:complete
MGRWQSTCQKERPSAKGQETRQATKEKMSNFSDAKLSVSQSVQSVTQLFLRHESGLLDEAISKLHEVESLIQKAEREVQDDV